MKRSLDADLKIKCGDDKSFMAHSALLTIASPVFSTMLTSGMQESKEWTISLPEPLHIVEMFYKHLHIQTVPDIEATIEELWAIAHLAHRYEVKRLMEYLQKQIIADHLDNGPSVALSYIHAKKLDWQEILILCENQMGLFYSYFLFTPEIYDELDEHIPNKMLNRLVELRTCWDTYEGIRSHCHHCHFKTNLPARFNNFAANPLSAKSVARDFLHAYLTAAC